MLGLMGQLGKETVDTGANPAGEEMWNDSPNPYSAVTNPIGRDGGTYIGAFDRGTDDDAFLAGNATLSIVLGTFRITATATNGSASVAFETLPGVSYNLKIAIISVEAGNAGIVMIGTSAVDGTYYNSGNKTGAEALSSTFVATTERSYLSIVSKTNTKSVTVDNIFLTEI